MRWKQFLEVRDWLKIAVISLEGSDKFIIKILFRRNFML